MPELTRGHLYRVNLQYNSTGPDWVAPPLHNYQGRALLQIIGERDSHGLRAVNLVIIHEGRTYILGRFREDVLVEDCGPAHVIFDTPESR